MIRALLTIDDVSSKNTPAIVDYLTEKKIPVIMFMVGKWAEGHPEELIYALKHGIIVGNHSFSHLEFSKLTFEQGVAEIEKCEEILDKLYKAAGVERKFRPFRFPYGDKGGANKDAFQKYLADNCFDKLDDRDISYPWWKEMGLDKDIDTLWTFDFAEYNIRRGNDFTIDDVWKRVNDPAPGSGAAILKDGGRHIILLHAHDETEELVPGYYKLFIDKLLENGVEFVEPNFIHI